MIKLSESKKIDEEGTQVGGVLSNPVDNIIQADDDEENKKRKQKVVNEDLDCEPIDTTEVPLGTVDVADTDPMINVPKYPIDADPCDVRLVGIEKNDNSYEFDDPKFLDIIDKLAENGYSAKFFGSEGYLITNNADNNVKLICRTISEGFKINIIGGLYDSATAKEVSKSLNRMTKLVDELNAMLMDTDSVDESMMVDLLGLGVLDD